MKIVGAGLSGLLAGCLIPNATIIEASSPRASGAHKAVLRFRSPDVGNALGIEFRPVTVYKGIWSHGPQPPSPDLANQYSKKVIGRLADRSIWNLAPSTRYIAPENLYQQMMERCAQRILWDTNIADYRGLKDKDTTIISTIPMPSMMTALNCEAGGPQFNFAPITVQRFRIPGADVFQTIYFPSPSTPTYRASITGDLLIVESMGDVDAISKTEVAAAFGIHANDMEAIDNAKQRFGKIAPVDDIWRRNFIHNITQSFGIYSLGRFATWRNILLDDVLKDIYVVRRLMKGDHYSAKQQAYK